MAKVATRRRPGEEVVLGLPTLESQKLNQVN